MATKQKRKPIAQQPTTAVAGGLTLSNLVTFMPPSWQPYGYGIAALLGAVAPIMMAFAQRSGDGR